MSTNADVNECFKVIESDTFRGKLLQTFFSLLQSGWRQPGRNTSKTDINDEINIVDLSNLSLGL